MSDREWLESVAFSEEIYTSSPTPVTNGNYTLALVSFDDALEYGERCAKSAKRTCRLIYPANGYGSPACSACGNDQGWHGVHYCLNCGAEVCYE